MRRPSKPSTASSRQISNWHIGSLVVALIALIACAWFAYVNWFPKPPAKPDAIWTHILATGALRVGIDPSFPPFESDDGKGHLAGMDIALIDELLREWSTANDLPLHAEYIYTGYDGLYDALKAGQFDAIVSALPYDPRRTEDVRFSHSYFDGGPWLIVREGDPTTQTYYDLQGKRVGVELGTTGDAFARRWQKRLRLDLQEFDTSADALRALQLGRVDSVFADIIAFNDFALSQSGLKTIGDPLVNELTVIAVNKDAPTLLGQINAVIDAMKQDGRMEQLWKAWLINQ
jgi:ABC-type amino acid transport substrate-binding protein